MANLTPKGRRNLFRLIDNRGEEEEENFYNNPKFKKDLEEFKKLFYEDEGSVVRADRPYFESMKAPNDSEEIVAVDNSNPFIYESLFENMIKKYRESGLYSSIQSEEVERIDKVLDELKEFVDVDFTHRDDDKD
jgi:hypothetical protein